MNETGVTDLNVRVKMKHTEQKMKPISVGNPDVEVKMKQTGVTDLDALIQMKPTE